MRSVTSMAEVEGENAQVSQSSSELEPAMAVRSLVLESFYHLSVVGASQINTEGSRKG